MKILISFNVTFLQNENIFVAESLVLTNRYGLYCDLFLRVCAVASISDVSYQVCSALPSVLKTNEYY